MARHSQSAGPFCSRIKVGKHRKLEPTTVQGICVECGERPQRKTGKHPVRGQIYSALCGRCTHKRNPQKQPSKRPPDYWRGWRRESYRLGKADHCAKCGFVAEDPCQLDVDHIDGNHTNDDLNNLQTLCANCHRLKTKMSGDGPYRNTKPEKFHGIRG